ncbi:MAP/microtubule affinity-regulating kinase 3-like [Oppia nitens]|uniref:MAP/microtubule affinity-regulating kinase 3-like n=1 Tax=Oppia nitens TaxID=1686743 RepID=UPI0023DC2DAE|nr:MAP/microtubule affinity-regulating kinase 3-like [Oppia nitens]
MCYRLFEYLLRHCCCCCYQRKSESMKTKTKQQQQYQRQCSQLSAKIHENITSKDSPDKLKTEEMSRQYRIPQEYPTEEAVIEDVGYKRLNVLGEGSFASVFKAKHIESGTLVAIKRVPIRRTFRQTSDATKTATYDLKNELYILATVRHPHIVQLIRHFIVATDNTFTLYIVMPIAEGGSLSDYLNQNGSFPDKRCQTFLSQIMNALLFMKTRHIAHRDLKLSNILLDAKRDVLITDFGLSRVLWRDSIQGVIDSTTLCGTPQYMAPELFAKYAKDKNPLKYNAHAVDVWAVGVILFKLCTGIYPFPNDKKRALRHMNERKIRFKGDVKNMSEKIRAFLHKIFTPDPIQRPPLEELVKDEWIRVEYNKQQILINDYMKKLIVKTNENVDQNNNKKDNNISISGQQK